MPRTVAAFAPPISRSGRDAERKPADEPVTNTETKSPAPSEEKDPDPPLPRALLAELLGTFALTFVAAGGGAVASVSGGAVSHAARSVAPGLVVLALIYSLGDASGMHVNPAVTLAFALRRDFPWRRVLPYWLAQLFGATLAALALFGLFGDALRAGNTVPHHVSMTAAFALEFFLSTLLITVILGTATKYSLIGPHAAVAVGATIALCGLWAGPITGASMNPARTLGPALVSGETKALWVYLLGPTLGSALAVLLTDVLHDRHGAQEKRLPREVRESCQRRHDENEPGFEPSADHRGRGISADAERHH
jgi:aquaporin Z